MSSRGPQSACLFFCFILLFNSAASAGTLTWANAEGGNWENPANWSPALVPEAVDDVVISGGTNTVVDSDVLVNSLLSTGSGTLSINLGSFTVSGQPCILDPTTNLWWPKDAMAAGSMVWQDPQMALLDLCGITGWRLPTIDEFAAFLTEGSVTLSSAPCGGSESCYIEGVAHDFNPSLTARGFDALQSNYWWSSTSYDDAFAWGFATPYGDIHTGAKDGHASIWPVRDSRFP